jgi:putative FmdB family regulatory protein
MPTYDYECDACGAKYELFQPITAKAAKKCPKCGSHKTRRLIGAGAGLIFKGSGFYETDYKPHAAPEKKTETASGADKSGQPAATKDVAAPAPQKSAGQDVATGVAKT